MVQHSLTGVVLEPLSQSDVPLVRARRRLLQLAPLSAEPLMS